MKSSVAAVYMITAAVGVSQTDQGSVDDDIIHQPNPRPWHPQTNKLASHGRRALFHS